MIHAYTYGGMTFFAGLEEGREPRAYKLGGWGVIPRIDTDLFYLLRGGVGNSGIEMDVGHEGGRIAFPVQFFAYASEIGGFAFSLGGETNVFRAGFNHPYRLGGGGGRVHRRDIGH
jgi:hypothetical protein